MSDSNLDELCINTIRFLAAEAVEKAKSGHPGLPMGAAPMAYVLWDRILKHNPSDPKWPDRDRFILSAGHGSMMLYSLLYLTGYNVTLNDIKNFRQLESKTPGHPEYGLTPGVEVTTGPLGQGFANGIGMAVAERRLASLYNKPDFNLIDHFTYAIVSDGDLQEGVASEAASLAGTWHLNKLIYIYDSNGVQQDGKTEVSFTEDVSMRFKAYGWNVIGTIDGLDLYAIEWAIKSAQAEMNRPNLIIYKTIIGYGSPNKAGTKAAHGEPLGENEIKLTKEKLGWNYPEPFSVPSAVLKHLRKAMERGACEQLVWESKKKEYQNRFPQEYAQLKQDLEENIHVGWDTFISNLSKEISQPAATRDTSGIVLNLVADKIHSFIGGAADLAGSTRTIFKGKSDFNFDNYAGCNIHYGLREHAMAAITNGLALHGGILPLAATFLVFSDYMRPAIRLASMMKLGVIYIFTHDSIGLGEDGPTHQPVEQIVSLRAMPGLYVIRPADTVETIEAWKIALERRDGPTALILTRQNVPILDRSRLSSEDGIHNGGYVLWESRKLPRIILIGTGSEVHIALAAGRLLENQDIGVRVVSLPCWELFDKQSAQYRESILPRSISPRISIEAGSPIGWEKYVGLYGKAIGISRFGISAPGNQVFEYFKFTPQYVVDEAIKLIEGV